MPENMEQCKTPDEAAAYWRAHIHDHPYFNPECECLVVSRPKHSSTHQEALSGVYWNDGYNSLSSPGDLRLAVMASAAAIVIADNHPSGDATPSDADIKITRDLIPAGQLLKIEVLDHIILGQLHPHKPSNPWLLL